MSPDYTVDVMRSINAMAERLRREFKHRAPPVETVDESQLVANLQTGPRTKHSTRKMVGNGTALTAKPSDATTSIPFKILPDESRQRIISLRNEVRAVQQNLDEQNSKKEMLSAIETLSMAVLGLLHMAIDDPEREADERERRMSEDEGFRQEQEAEDMHIYEPSGDLVPRIPERFNEEVHPDLKRQRKIR